MSLIDTITNLLSNEADDLLNYTCTAVRKNQIYLPSADWVDRIFAPSDRSLPVLRSLQTLFDHGRLNSTGFFIDSSGGSRN